ncbi:MAG: hypothetical protein U0457_08175 [Candidatus Sericytochromatia bacterium]
MQFEVFEEGIEVSGGAVLSIVDGLSDFQKLTKKYLLDIGLGVEKNGKTFIDPNEWYSQKKWLESFEKLSQDIGNLVLKQIGEKIPENAVFPPWVVDIESAIKSIDVAYHLNHRKKGKIMFDLETGEMEEGIGHYGYEKIEGKNKIICECKNPYPCQFDLGIITAMAKKFQRNAFIFHDKDKPCRKTGGESCTYTITW